MPTESSRRSKRHRSVTPDERAPDIEQELEAWRTRAVPDASTPLEAEDVARLVRGCFDAVGLDQSLAESFSVHTVHYYRRKEILDAPEGRTSAARYTLRHVWQAAGARLAGQLGLLTLAEARTRMHEATDDELRAFVASRIADARGRHASRQAPSPSVDVRALAVPTMQAAARPLGGAAIHGSAVEVGRIEEPPSTSDFTYPPLAAPRATVIPLSGNALCLIPEKHAARRSRTAARALVNALAAALGVTPES